jgi:uncharacterized protein YqjF (DUF2071 family)
MSHPHAPSTRIIGGGPEGVYDLPPPTGPVVMHQRWRELLFLHWVIDPAVIAATLPPGLTVDTFCREDGGPHRAYLGIVPFQMQRVRPRFLPPVPGLSWFGELNLRTYVLGPDGRPGVWFYSLDAHQHLAVWLARKLFALPYHHAVIRSRRRGERVDYGWRRGGPIDPASEPAFAYDTPSAEDAAPVQPGTLEHFLVERYLLYSRRPLFLYETSGPSAPGHDGELWVGRVDHPPYRTAPARLIQSDHQLFALNGLAPPGSAPPCSVLWSPGVDVEVYPLRRA